MKIKWPFSKKEKTEEVFWEDAVSALLKNKTVLDSYDNVYTIEDAGPYLYVIPVEKDSWGDFSKLPITVRGLNGTAYQICDSGVGVGRERLYVKGVNDPFDSFIQEMKKRDKDQNFIYRKGAKDALRAVLVANPNIFNGYTSAVDLKAIVDSWVELKPELEKLLKDGYIHE